MDSKTSTEKNNDKTHRVDVPHSQSQEAPKETNPIVILITGP